LYRTSKDPLIKPAAGTNQQPPDDSLFIAAWQRVRIEPPANKAFATGCVAFLFGSVQRGHDRLRKQEGVDIGALFHGLIFVSADTVAGVSVSAPNIPRLSLPCSLIDSLRNRDRMSAKRTKS
jgi:hypothetical protein